MKKTVATQEVSASLSREIGRVIVRYAYAEHYIQRIVYLLMGVDNKFGRVAVREPRITDGLKTVIPQLAQLRGLSLSKTQMKSLCSIANDIKKQRDLLAHGLWTLDPEVREYAVQDTSGSWPKQPHTPSVSKKISPAGYVYQPADVANIDQAIQHFIAELAELRALLEAQLQTPQPK